MAVVHTAEDGLLRVMEAGGRATVEVDVRRRAATAEELLRMVAGRRMAEGLRTAAVAVADMGGKARLGFLLA